MSTPAPRNSKLDGLEAYAPPWARAQAEPESERVSAQTDGAVVAETPPASEETCSGPADSASAPDVHTRIDDAIQRAIEIGRMRGAPEPLESVARATQRPTAVKPLRAEAATAPRVSAPRRPSVDGFRAEPRRRSPLDPDIVPEPPPGVHRPVAPMIGRLALATGLAAIIAAGVTLISFSQFEFRRTEAVGPRMAAMVPVATDTAVKPKTNPAPKPPARLVVENQQAFENEPVPLAISVDGATGRERLLLVGLSAGTRLSAGSRLDDSRWQLPLSELRNVYLYAPTDFVGVMNAAVNLLSPSEQLMDTRAVQFEWTKKPKPPQVAAASAPGVATATAIQPRDREQDEFLMKRGEDLLNTGDIAGARIAFQRLAEAGNAKAALALGVTYDPRFLTKRNVIGVVGDEAMAHAWYQRAAELGSTEAKSILAQTAEK